MKLFSTLLVMVFATQAQASIFDNWTNSSLCHDTVEEFMNQSYWDSLKNTQKKFMGVNLKTAQPCEITFIVNENDNREGHISADVNAATFMPFGHYVYISEKNCSGDTARNAYRQPTGWRKKISTTLELRRIPHDNQWQVTYTEDHSTISCQGAIQ